VPLLAPAETATDDASVVVPSMKVTVPVGTLPLLPGIVAVNVTDWLKTGAVGFAVSVVVLAVSK
jgi:hypothetical protein